MKIPFVNLERMHQPIREEIDCAIKSVIDQNNYINGEQIKSFEQHFARFLEVKYVAGVSSGTDALFLALIALGIQYGEYVITVPNTFVATTEAITMAGGKVVLTDVDPSTRNMSPSALRQLLEDQGETWRKNCRAIIFVNLYGNPAGLADIAQIAQEFGIALISDAAQAHGARLSGKTITSLADITTYSFFPGKNLGAFGDAGAVATDNDTLAEKLAMLRNHGRKKKYIHEIEAYNCRIDTIQAAVLDVKLKRLNQWNENRIRQAQKYNKLLGSTKFKCPEMTESITAVYHLYVIETSARDAMIEKLKQAGIASGIHYPLPIHLQPAYGYLDYSKGDFPVSETLSEQILSLPIDGGISDEEIEYIVSALVK